MTEESEFVRLEVDDGVGTIRLDRPKMNALNAQVQEEIRAAATEATERDDVRAVVVYGGERVFAAGADIKEMNEMSYTDMVERSGKLQGALTARRPIPKPVVAAITGYALGGGCELALCADVRFAADDAVLGQPEILLGIIPGAGGTQRLTRLVGPSIGQGPDLHRPVRQGRRGARASAWSTRSSPPARSTTRRSPGPGSSPTRPAYALRAAKETIDRGSEVDLETGLEIERQQFAALFATEDRSIGHGVLRRARPGQGGVPRPLTPRAPPRGCPYDPPMARRKAEAADDKDTPGSKAGGASAMDRVRTRIAQVVWLVCVVCALLLAVGALLVALDANPRTPWSGSCSTGADAVDLGVFSRQNGIKEFPGENADVKNALLNWGLGAVAYLVVGRILDR